MLLMRRVQSAKPTCHGSMGAGISGGAPCRCRQRALGVADGLASCPARDFAVGLPGVATPVAAWLHCCPDACARLSAHRRVSSDACACVPHRQTRAHRAWCGRAGGRSGATVLKRLAGHLRDGLGPAPRRLAGTTAVPFEAFAARRTEAGLAPAQITHMRAALRARRRRQGSGEWACGEVA